MPETDDALKHQRNIDIQALTELNAGYVQSVQHSNVQWFEEHLSPDFLNGNPDGTQVTRAQFLRQIARPCPVKALHAEEVQIRLFGEMAVIHARTVYVSPEGQPGTGRYTDIWVRSAGKWLCVSADVRRN